MRRAACAVLFLLAGPPVWAGGVQTGAAPSAPAAFSGPAVLPPGAAPDLRLSPESPSAVLLDPGPAATPAPPELAASPQPSAAALVLAVSLALPQAPISAPTPVLPVRPSAADSPQAPGDSSGPPQTASAQAARAAAALEQGPEGSSDPLGTSVGRLNAVFDLGARPRPVAVEIPGTPGGEGTAALDDATVARIPASAKDDSARFQAIFASILDGKPAEAPASARGIRFLFIPGFGWERFPGYFKRNMEALSALGLPVEFVRIHSLGNEEQNGRIIADAIEASDSPVAIIAHSMAGLHARRALEDAPHLRSKVVRLAAIQSPFFGTSLADWFMKHTWLFDLIVLFNKIVNPEGMRDVRLFHHYDTIEEMSRRHREPLAEKPFPLEIEKVFSLTSRVADFTIGQFPFWLRTHVLRSLPKRDTDGAIETGRTILPGSRFAILNGVNHSDPVEDPAPGLLAALMEPHLQAAGFAANLTLALLHWMFPG